MKYGELNLGQIEALVNKAGGLAGVLKVLSGEWIVGTPAEVKQVKRTVTKILKRLGMQTIDCPAQNPKSGFWKTGTGLWVDSALAPILQAAESLPAGRVSFNCHLIEKDGGALDSEIRAKGAGLRAKNTYTPGQFLQLAQTLIEAQPGGIAGTLLNTGKANIFYVLCDGVVFLVRVRWDQHSGQWRVYVWQYVDYRWLVGRQVFSPAT